MDEQANNRSPSLTPREPPYGQHLAKLETDTEDAIASSRPFASETHCTSKHLRDVLTTHIERRAHALETLSHEIHARPELAFEEHYAVSRIARLLETNGHSPELGAFSLETAFRVSSGRGRPKITILAEYDALPDIGHACGHNVIAAAAVGAYLALAAVIEELDGSIELIGSPAEEGGGGKALIAAAGGFEGCDAAMMVHPAGFDVGTQPWLGRRRVDVTYHGLSAHASMMPFAGRNALDAVVIAYTGISQLRQHILPQDRVHGIITEGGQKPNVIPERAAACFYLRSGTAEGLEELSRRVEGVFRAAATCSATDVTIDWDARPIQLPMRNNHALARTYGLALQDRGRKVLPLGVIPPEWTGSTDMGNVSHIVPAIHPTIKIAPLTTALHSHAFARYAASPQADAAVIDGAVGLAVTAAEFFVDAQLRSAVVAEFEASGGVSNGAPPSPTGNQGRSNLL